MKRVLRKLVHHYRQGGAPGLMRKAADYLRDRLWSDTHWLVYERVLAGDTDRVAEAVSLRELGTRELAEVGYFRMKAFPEDITRRFRDGHVCHGFYVGNCLATVGWSSAGCLELDANVRFPCPTAVGLFDFHTFKEFRSRGYYTNALQQLANVMRDKHFTRALIAVDPGNLPSVRGIERAGFRRVLQVTRRRRLGVSTIRQRSVAESAP